MKRTFLSLLLSAIFIGGGALLLELSFQKEKTSPEFSNLSFSVAVEVISVSREDYTETIIAYGQAKAFHNTTVKSQISGTIVRVSSFLQEGKNVEKGDLLVQINDREQQNLLKEAQAHLREAEASLKILQIAVKNLTDEIVLMAKELEISKREVQRYQGLENQADITSSRLDNQMIQHSIRKRLYLKMKGELRLREAEAEKIMAQIAVRKSKRAFAQYQLEKMSIHAPYSGQILKRHANEGSWVSPGTPLFEIFDSEKRIVELAIPAAHFNKSLLKNKVNLRLGKEKEVVWQGKIDRISQRIDERRNFLGFVDVDSNIPPGSFVIAEITGETYKEVFAIPRLALEENKVFVIERQGPESKIFAKKIQVRVVATIGNFALVDKGLMNEAEVIVAGIEKIGSGSQVEIVQKKSP